MNLIASERKLDRLQENAIYELTLKKQQSKKSFVSQKQVAAMQQLANELISQRKDFREFVGGQSEQHVASDYNKCQCIKPNEVTIKKLPQITSCIKTTTSNCSSKSASSHTSTNSTSSTSSSCSSSSTLSDDHADAAPSSCSSSTSSTSLLSSPDNHLSGKSEQILAPAERTDELHKETLAISGASFLSTVSGASTSSLMSDETNIKLNRMRLEQLNNELERRLHQYEYLVAQEKAILGAYKINLFTSEGVNNFHLFHKNAPYKC